MSPVRRDGAEAGASGAVVAVVVGVVALLVLVVAVVGFLLVRLRGDSAPRTDVTVTSTLTPSADGVAVHAEIVAVDGRLPGSLRIPAEVVERDLSSPVSDVRIGARSGVSSVTVDGRPVEPEQDVEVSGAKVVVDYVVGPQDDGGHRVAFSLLDVAGLRPVRAEVTVEGDPVSCDVPVGYRPGDSTRVWTTACPASPVTVERAAPTEPGYSGSPAPAWVRVDFGP